MKGIIGSRHYKFAGYARPYTQGGETVVIRAENPDGDVKMFRVSIKTAERLAEADRLTECEED